jgi:ATP-dependent exoDNAse (exonuclease V) beta subunit
VNTIQIISASAGSGKTFRLTALLEEGVVNGTVRPQAVLATTFTNKSAAELQERVRVRLLKAGRVEAAQQLSAARIGTVNSVCGRLVGDFAFELGLSPDLRVLDEEPAKLALIRCISSVLSPAEEKELQDLTERMVAFDWQQAVRQMVTLARANLIPADKLSAARDRSWKEYRKLLATPEDTEADLDAALLGAMKGFLKAAARIKDKTKTTKEAVSLVKQCVNRMDRGIPLAWSRWVALAKEHAAKASDGVLEPVRVAASAQDRHPRLHRDVKRAIELVFDLTAQTLAFYQEHKRELGAIDFVDQETYALQLLGRKEVREQLMGDLDLVLIDEFQDTSPIQLAIFLRLAEATRHSVWVGDQKQAVYGFRGTDPMLMDAAIAEILEGREPETLPMSFRSRPGLVHFTSALFAPAFAQQGIPASRVNLKPALEKEPPGLGVFVECWPLTAKSNDQEAGALAAATKQLLEDKSVRVRDRMTDQPRPARPSDVAVLCRTPLGRQQGCVVGRRIGAAD